MTTRSRKKYRSIQKVSYYDPREKIVGKKKSSEKKMERKEISTIGLYYLLLCHGTTDTGGSLYIQGG